MAGLKSMSAECKVPCTHMSYLGTSCLRKPAQCQCYLERHEHRLLPVPFSADKTLTTQQPWTFGTSEVFCAAATPTPSESETVRRRDDWWDVTRTSLALRTGLLERIVPSSDTCSALISANKASICAGFRQQTLMRPFCRKIEIRCCWSFEKLKGILSLEGKLLCVIHQHESKEGTEGSSRSVQTGQLIPISIPTLVVWLCWTLPWTLITFGLSHADWETYKKEGTGIETEFSFSNVASWKWALSDGACLSILCRSSSPGVLKCALWAHLTRRNSLYWPLIPSSILTVFEILILRSHGRVFNLFLGFLRPTCQMCSRHERQIREPKSFVLVRSKHLSLASLWSLQTFHTKTFEQDVNSLVLRSGWVLMHVFKCKFTTFSNVVKWPRKRVSCRCFKWGVNKSSTKNTIGHD